jgi:hypothetical protein
MGTSECKFEFRARYHKKIGAKISDANERSNNKILTKQEKKGPINIHYKKEDRLADQNIYGTNGVRKISKRMDRGQSHTRAAITEGGRQVTIGTALSMITVNAMSGGAFFKTGVSAVKKIMSSEIARKSVTKIAQNKKFNPIDVAFEVLD